METDPKSAGEELRIAIAGSLLSGVVAIVFAIPALVIDFGPLAAAPDPVQAVGFVATMVAIFNAMLGLINLVPGYPMDGARVLHAVAWSRTGSQQAAAAVAIRVGRYVGYCLIGVGLVDDPPKELRLVTPFPGWHPGEFLDPRADKTETAFRALVKNHSRPAAHQTVKLGFGPQESNKHLPPGGFRVQMSIPGCLGQFADRRQHGT